MTNRTIPGVLHRAAAAFGSLEAVVDGGSRLSFGEVEPAVELRARALVTSGVVPGDRVALWAPNSLEWVLISFAVYCSGAVLVPVNTRFKGPEAAHVLATSGARLIFTVADFLGSDYVEMLRAEMRADPLALNRLEEIVTISGTRDSATSLEAFLGRSGSTAESELRHREVALEPEDPSDIIFTSGTTGRPKGVVLSHGASIDTYVQWSQRVGLRRGDRGLMIYPFFHTAGLKSSVLASFLVGVTIVPHAVFDPVSVMSRVSEERISFLPGPPSVFQSLLVHPERSRFDLSSLRLSVTGAATVPVELIDRMATVLELESVVTAYGLTETHGTVTACSSSDSADTIAKTVGRPLTGLDLRVVDDMGSGVPIGESGEVTVRGFNVMAGYFEDPEATADVLDESGWLRTGDIGWLGQDGYLRIVDRKKDMIIVGGFNVSSAEVEACILERAEVAQAALVAVPDERLGEVGCVFVVPRPGASVDTDGLLGWCRQRMANYKVPRFVSVVDALPINASGKVQKFVLRDQARSLVHGGR